jgi:hypothetical protein
VGTTEASSDSSTVIGGREGECATGGEGTWVGDGGGGGVGRVAPMKSLGNKPAAIISRSNSSPTMMCPGRVVSSGEAPCPLEKASSTERRQKFVGFLSGRVMHHRGIQEPRQLKTERPHRTPSGPTNREKAGIQNEHQVPLSGLVKYEQYLGALRRARDRDEGPSLGTGS